MSSPERDKQETAAVLCDRLKLWAQLIRSDREVRLLWLPLLFMRTSQQGRYRAMAQAIQPSYWFCLPG
jgi:hypothetical protein